MSFKNKLFSAIFTESQKNILTKDPYARLCEFEHMITTQMRLDVLSTAELIEGHRLLALINQAQIHVLERKMGVDLDGDGLVAGL